MQNPVKKKRKESVYSVYKRILGHPLMLIKGFMFVLKKKDTVKNEKCF